MNRTALLRAAPVGLAFLAATGCESTGPNLGETRVLLSQGAVSAAAAPAFAVLLQEADVEAASALSIDLIESIEVSVTGVQALRSGEDEGDHGPWISLEVTAPTTLNLLELPSTSEDGLLLAQGELGEGSYGNLRIRFDEAFVTFTEEVQVGQSVYPAGEPIALFVPSGSQTGVKVPDAAFTVEEDAGAEVVVVFDPEQSAVNIVPTGANKVILTPVLGVKK